MKNIFKFFYAAVLVILTAYVCSVFTRSGLTGWYHDFVKPAVTPPDMVFPVFWTIIYALLIIAFFIALRIAPVPERGSVNRLFILQLVLQIVWCLSFFAAGQLALGLAVIVLLDIAVFRMIKVFRRISRLSGWLLYPYFGWLLFATLLNAAFVITGGVAVSF